MSLANPVIEEGVPQDEDSEEVKLKLMTKTEPSSEELQESEVNSG